jgi:transposase
VWARRNTRPRVIKQTEYKWVYLYGAVNPETGQSAGMIGSTVDTEMMSLFLYWMGKEISPGSHAVLVLDGAGWHKSKALRVPDHITLLFLPPYSPELNPTELVWLWLKEHHLSNRIFPDQDHLDRAALDARNTLDADRFKSLCSAPWITREIQT